MTDEQIIELAKQAGFWEPMGLPSDWEDGDYVVSPQELQRFAELLRSQLVDEVRQEVRNEVQEEAAKDTARFMWAMRNMANPFGRHEFGLAQHIIDRGGDGDVDDFRSYVDEMMEYDK